MLNLSLTFIISLSQDQFDIVGERTSLGLAAWHDVVATEDAALVKTLTAAGAILYVKTNVPQSLMVRSTVFASLRMLVMLLFRVQ